MDAIHADHFHTCRAELFGLAQSVQTLDRARRTYHQVTRDASENTAK